MVERSDMEYVGLTRREIEMRMRMAQKFGRKATHLKPPDPEEIQVDTQKLLSQPLKSPVDPALAEGDQELNLPSDTGTSNYVRDGIPSLRQAKAAQQSAKALQSSN